MYFLLSKAFCRLFNVNFKYSSANLFFNIGDYGLHRHAACGLFENVTDNGRAFFVYDYLVVDNIVTYEQMTAREIAFCSCLDKTVFDALTKFSAILLGKHFEKPLNQLSLVGIIDLLFGINYLYAVTTEQSLV